MLGKEQDFMLAGWLGQGLLHLSYQYDIKSYHNSLLILVCGDELSLVPQTLPRQIFAKRLPAFPILP